jgi:hypothetical protein
MFAGQVYGAEERSFCVVNEHRGTTRNTANGQRCRFSEVSGQAVR